MATQEEREIAATIRSQIFAGGAITVLSWGAHGWTIMPRRAPFLGGLRFSVDGRIYQGPVNVLLSGDDTYTLEIGAMSYRDLHCEQLTPIIDECVESGE